MLKKTAKTVLCLLLTGMLGMISCKNSSSIITPVPAANVDYEVSIMNEEQGIVSPNLMGFNIVYSYEKDAAWQNGNGKVPELLKSIGTRHLRYPGGTVATFFHWNNPTGQGWSDTWNPRFNEAENLAPSDFMDLDEYLAIIQKMNIEPLVGINMGSGKKYDRVQEGVEEAKALVQHCLDKGVRVKYYYLDNEPYHKTANYTYTPEEYAEQINRYATEMRKIDPAIKTIVNTHPNNDTYTKTLIKEAGDNIDFVDVHNYWKFNNASFASWKSEPKMMHQGKFTYSEQREYFKNIFQELGHPAIDLVVLEWNIGPMVSGTELPSEAEVALMVSEQFTQFIQSGLPMACFWPLTWPGSPAWANRILINTTEGYSPNKVYNMFALYTDVLGQMKVKSSASAERLINVAVKSQDGNTVWVYLINKNLDKPTVEVNLALEDFKAKDYSAIGFESTDITDGPLAVKDIIIKQRGDTIYSLTMPQFSLAKITLKR